MHRSTKEKIIFSNAIILRVLKLSYLVTGLTNENLNPSSISVVPSLGNKLYKSFRYSLR